MSATHSLIFLFIKRYVYIHVHVHVHVHCTCSVKATCISTCILPLSTALPHSHTHTHTHTHTHSLPLIPSTPPPPSSNHRGEDVCNTVGGGSCGQVQEGGDRGSAADREEQGDAQSADSAICRGGETEGGDEAAQGE